LNSGDANAAPITEAWKLDLLRKIVGNGGGNR
jgi:hypothetical protein